MMLIDPSPLWPKIVKYTVSSLYITTTRTTFTLSNVYQIYGMLLTLFPPYSIMFTVCIDFIDVFPTTEFLLSFFFLEYAFSINWFSFNKAMNNSVGLLRCVTYSSDAVEVYMYTWTNKNSSVCLNWQFTLNLQVLIYFFLKIVERIVLLSFNLLIYVTRTSYLIVKLDVKLLKS